MNFFFFFKSKYEKGILNLNIRNQGTAGKCLCSDEAVPVGGDVSRDAGVSHTAARFLGRHRHFAASADPGAPRRRGGVVQPNKAWAPVDKSRHATRTADELAAWPHAGQERHARSAHCAGRRAAMGRWAEGGEGTPGGGP